MDNETVREVCAEMRDGEEGCYFPFTDNEIKVTKKVSNLLTAFADRILSAHNREMAAKDAEIAKLKAALKPVLECRSASCDVYQGRRCADAIREAQRIYTEGERWIVERTIKENGND